MNGCDRFEHFHFVLARKVFQQRLQAWLDAEPRQVRRVMGFRHDLLIRWRAPVAPEHRTTHALVSKFFEPDGRAWNMLQLDDRDIHTVAEGRNDYFLFVFWRARVRRGRIRYWLRQQLLRLID